MYNKIKQIIKEELEKLNNEGWMFNTNDVGNERYLIGETEFGKVYCVRCFRWND